MTQIDPKIARKVEEKLFKQGAVMVPITAKMFLNEYGEKLVNDDAGPILEMIESFRENHPERFLSNVPNLMERKADGSLRYSQKEADEIVAAQSKALNYGTDKADQPQPIDLMERDERGNLKYTAKEADAAIERVIVAMRRGAYEQK